MLNIKNLTIKDLKNHVFIENFNYSLGNEDKVGIIGEEGNGKSTFLKALYDKNEIKEYMVMSGEILHDFKHIGYLTQSLPFHWEDVSVSDYLLKQKPDEELAYERYNDLQEYEILCQQMQLPRSLLQQDRVMCTLSGGERVKLQMMKLIAQPCDFLLLDEPTNDLDMATLEWMESFILHCSIPIMFISHDVRLLERCANVLLHFEQLNRQSTCTLTVFKGNYQDYIVQRNHQQERDKQQASKEKQEYVKKKIRLNDQRNALHDALNDIVRNPAKAAQLKRKMRNIKANEKRFEKEGYTKINTFEDAIHIQFPPMTTHAQKIIVECRLPQVSIGERILMRDVELFVRGKDKVILTGANGCGKSIYMKIIYEQLKQRTDICLGYMPQNYNEYMDGKQTPVQFLMEKGDRQDRTRCHELLGSMKFTAQEMEHCIMGLSEGQKAKLYLLSFVKRQCDVLLLDEPTRNLSPLSSPIIIRLLKEYAGCLIVVSHDRLLLETVPAKIYKIEKQSMREVARDER